MRKRRRRRSRKRGGGLQVEKEEDEEDEGENHSRIVAGSSHSLLWSNEKVSTVAKQPTA